ncbi:adenosine kinase [Candidatus Woesearchaeota archaeon]|nr:adenosine kinase [Candidatus Woesearchaeota archaeon]
MSPLDLLVITNAVTDLVYPVSTEFLQDLDLRRGAEHRALLRSQVAQKLEAISLSYESPAGSPANVGFSTAVLGLKVGIVGCLGNDLLGTAYRKMIQEYGIANHMQISSASESGVCYTFITPDGERTFLNQMNAAPHFDLKKAPTSAKIIHTSCYEIVGKEDEFITYLCRAKEAGAEISVDLANPHTCHKIGEKMKTVLDLTDILFASPEEYVAAVGREFTSHAENPHHHKIICLKYGVQGSRILAERIDHRIPIVPTTVVNTNGAGDGYAAGFLTAYLNGDDLSACGMNGSRIASRVVSQMGASLLKRH